MLASLDPVAVAADLAQRMALEVAEGISAQVMVLPAADGARSLRVEVEGSHNRLATVDARYALPAIANAYSPASHDGFTVHASRSAGRGVTLLDVQGQAHIIERPAGYRGDALLLASHQEGNGAYTYNLLFAYNHAARGLLLEAVVVNLNLSRCERAFASSYRLDGLLAQGSPLADFDGAQALRTLDAAYAQLQGSGKRHKLMPLELEQAVARALAAYKRADRPALEQHIAGLGIDDEGCSTASDVTEMLFFPGRLGWSNDVGLLLEQTGRYAQAVALLSAVVQADPDRVVARLNLADSYWGKGDPVQAARQYASYQALMARKGWSARAPARVAERLALGAVQ
ncbi:tetratricopeptide repeat protein [Pseudomonas sp. NPDC089406]|uniref:tetratricopeptide repeat protein n=1 Tax=Pseudomonas sp. NPDC089406 TaxID=3364463 RepID=UPI00384B2B0E